MALGFIHLSISESRGQGRDAIHPSGEMTDISRDRISCRHDQPASVNLMKY